MSALPDSPLSSIADLRQICGAFAHTQETFPFDATTLVFKVGGKMYALAGLKADPVQISLKVKPEDGERLRAEHAAIVAGYHLNKRHWVTVTLDGSVPDDLIHNLLQQSYLLVIKGLTRAERELLQ